MDGMCNFALQQAIPFSDLLLSIVRQWLQHAPRLSISSPTTLSASSPKGPESSGAVGGGEGGGEAKKAEQKKILVVEDNAMNQIVVSTFLKKAGYPFFPLSLSSSSPLLFLSLLFFVFFLNLVRYSFEFASDGQQGVDMYTSNPFGYQLILMDCQVPPSLPLFLSPLLPPCLLLYFPYSFHYIDARDGWLRGEYKDKRGRGCT